MDPMDILGGLLGGGKGSSGGGGLGGRILNELIKGAQRSGGAPRQRPMGTNKRPTNIDEAARRLEDLLGVAQDRQVTRDSSPAPAPPAPEPTSYRRPPSFDNAGSRYREPTRRPPPESAEPISQNDEVLVLVRAMINAAKADGRVTRDEQEEIIQRINNPTQDTITFLRSEFSKPVDVREFAWSVPIGMEQQVYTLSLASIDLDTNPEAQYLRDLAHGLRLEPELCNKLHQRYQAPAIF